MTWVRQDPDARRDYGFDWELTDGDTIATSVWESDDLTLEDESVAGATTIVFVSGGQVGGRYTITNRITTALGRSDDQTLHFQIEHS